MAVGLVVIVHGWYYAGAPSLRVPLPGAANGFDLAPLFNSSSVGVDLFFILSGLLLSRPWIVARNSGSEPPPVSRYAWLRFFRIVPAYYVSLFLMLLFMVPKYIPTTVVYSGLGVKMLAAHLTFTHFLFPASAGSYLINGSVWTLTIEVIFYVLLPLVVPLFYGQRWLVSVPVAVALSITWMYLCRHSLGPLVDAIASANAADGWTQSAAREFLSRQFPAHLTDFAVGITLQNWFCLRQARARADRAVLSWLGAPGRMTVAFAAGVGLLLFFMYRMSADVDPLFPVYLKGVSMALSFGLIVLGLEKGVTVLRAFFSLPLLRFYGIIAYSLFLWHMPVIHIVISYPRIAALAPASRMFAVYAVAGILATILAFGSYAAIERPFMLWSRRNLPRVRPALAIKGMKAMIATPGK